MKAFEIMSSEFERIVVGLYAKQVSLDGRE
jgi:hypothetical protein